jgi:hypothetical protein
LARFKLNSNTLTSYLNIQISKTMTGFELLQAYYIQVILKELKLEGLHICRLSLMDRAIKALLSEHIIELPTLPSCEITLYQSIVGKLYTAIYTRFDIMFSIGILSRYSHALNLHHMAMAKHILDYLKYILNAKLGYHRSDSKKVTTYAYVDADFANTPGRKSVSEITLSINYYLIYGNLKSNQLSLPPHLK